MNSRTLLERGQEHLREVSTTRDGEQKHLLSVEAVILTAAAVECATNWFLAIPLLVVQHNDTRVYAERLIAHFSRGRIRDKIDFLLDFYPDCALSKAQKRNLKELFELRNCFVHSSPELVEGYYVPDDWDRWGEEIDVEALPRQRSLSSRLDIDKLDRITDMLSTAASFVDRLEELSQEVVARFAPPAASTNEPAGGGFN